MLTSYNDFETNGNFRTFSNRDICIYLIRDHKNSIAINKIEMRKSKGYFQMYWGVYALKGHVQYYNIKLLLLPSYITLRLLALRLKACLAIFRHILAIKLFQKNPCCVRTQFVLLRILSFNAIFREIQNLHFQVGKNGCQQLSFSHSAMYIAIKSNNIYSIRPSINFLSNTFFK